MLSENIVRQTPSIIKSIKDQGLPDSGAMKAFTPDSIMIDKAIPFQANSTTYYLVNVKFKAPEEIGGFLQNEATNENSLVMAVDSSGEFQFDSVIKISSNENMMLPAKRILTKTSIPNEVGEILYTGKGSEEIVFVSDVF